MAHKSLIDFSLASQNKSLGREKNGIVNIFSDLLILMQIYLFKIYLHVHLILEELAGTFE